MNSFSNDKNINFMVFENQISIEDYLTYEVVKFIKAKKGLNLAIESRVEFFSLLNRLRDECVNGKVSFSSVNYFMTDDYVFDLSNWEYFQNNSNERIVENILFNNTDFVKENFHGIVDINRFNNFFNNVFNSYDAFIDANNGLDVLILKFHENGSLIFNESINNADLSSNAINMTTSIRKQISHEFNKSEFFPIACATLGMDQILKTRKIFIVGTGIKYADVVQKLFYTKDYDKSLPVCLLKNHPNVSVIMDKDASVGIFQPKNTKFTAHYPSTNLNNTDFGRNYVDEKSHYRETQQEPVNQFVQGVPANQQYQDQMYQQQFAQQQYPQQQYVQNDPMFDQQYLQQNQMAQPQEYYQQPVVDQQVQQQPQNFEVPHETINEIVVEQPAVEPQQVPQEPVAVDNQDSGVNIIIDNSNQSQQPAPAPVSAAPAQPAVEDDEDDDYDFDSLNDFQDI